MKSIQTHLKELKEEFHEQHVNYDDILCYATNHAMLHKIGNLFITISYIVRTEELDGIKEIYVQECETLNSLLLNYIPEKPNLGWCTFPSLLYRCGVVLSQALQEKLYRYVLFPGQEAHAEWEPLKTHVPISNMHHFHPSQEVSLQLSKHINLAELGEMVSELNEIHGPLHNGNKNHLRMLTFFHLSPCNIFNTYLRVQINHLAPYSTEGTASRSLHQQSILTFLPGMQFSKELRREEEMPIRKLVVSLDKTKELLSRIMEGNAEYSEIIAEGQLNLHGINVEKEFGCLKEFSEVAGLSCTALDGVRSMLEVFQYSTYILHIETVCTQYRLKGCLTDSKLASLKKIVGELHSDEERKKLTPSAALDIMNQVKKELTMPDPQHMEIFSAIQNSSEFFHFIRENHFDDESGKSMFQQRYQLVTAQLQHEEYNEAVLNHLFAAFQLIIPFLNVNQNLSKLLTQVSELDVTSGLKQLETVNSNIALISHWFSRTEVSWSHFYSV